MHQPHDKILNGGLPVNIMNNLYWLEPTGDTAVPVTLERLLQIDQTVGMLTANMASTLLCAYNVGERECNIIVQPEDEGPGFYVQLVPVPADRAPGDETILQKGLKNFQEDIVAASLDDGRECVSYDEDDECLFFEDTGAFYSALLTVHNGLDDVYDTDKLRAQCANDVDAIDDMLDEEDLRNCNSFTFLPEKTYQDRKALLRDAWYQQHAHIPYAYSAIARSIEETERRYASYDPDKKPRTYAQLFGMKLH